MLGEESLMKIQRINPQELNLYARIPMKFTVSSIFKIETIEKGLGGLIMMEKSLTTPYIKDYDEKETPLSWYKQFNLENWGIFLMGDGEQFIGGAAVATKTPAVNMLENRPDLAVLWDIRIHPDWQRKGYGRALFNHCVDWAGQQRFRQMKIETQNINVPACRFYASMGCELGMIHRYGYAADTTIAHEAMLFWYLDLGKRSK